jgi:hypothetical protein
MLKVVVLDVVPDLERLSGFRKDSSCVLIFFDRNYPFIRIMGK